MGVVDNIGFEVGDGVGRIVLARPDARNALSVGMRDRLITVIDECSANPDIRSVLVTAEGKAFCSGMDLRQSTVSEAGSEGFDPRSVSMTLEQGVHRIIKGLWNLDKPTVVAVAGHAVGPGAHLALSCDFVFVAEEAGFHWSFSKFGLVVDAGGGWLLPRLVGLPRAREMVLLNEPSIGQQSVDEGLAHRCLPHDKVEAEAEALAVRLATGPTRSMGLSKRLLNSAFESTLDDSLAAEAHYQALATASHDLVEGMAAFREKREANFEGR